MAKRAMKQLVQWSGTETADIDVARIELSALEGQEDTFDHRLGLHRPKGGQDMWFAMCSLWVPKGTPLPDGWHKIGSPVPA